MFLTSAISISFRPLLLSLLSISEVIKSCSTIVTYYNYETRTGWTLLKLTSLTNYLHLSPSSKS